MTLFPQVLIPRSRLAVTAGDATTFYKIVITRGAAAADASLNTLAFGADVTLVPAFSRHTYSYTATVPNSVRATTNVARTDNAEATQQPRRRRTGWAGCTGSNPP